jgi:hypothetical protein
MLDPFHSGKRMTAPRFGALCLNPDLLIIGSTNYKISTSITHRDCAQTQKRPLWGYFPQISPCQARRLLDCQSVEVDELCSRELSPGIALTGVGGDTTDFAQWLTGQSNWPSSFIVRVI